MPTVPTLEAPSVEEQPLPGRAYPRFSEEAPEAAFGSPIGVGLQHLSDVGVGEQVQQKQQNDQLRVVDAITQLSAAHDALLYGGDGKSGAFSMHGVDAVNMPQKFLPAYDDIAGRIAATLTPDQQRMFVGHVQTTKQQLGLQLNRYEFEESNRLAAQTYKAGQEQAISSAGLNYRDPQMVQKSILDLHALNEMEASREGWTPVEKHDALVASIARMHAGVIDAMLADGEGTTARGYYNAHVDELKEFDPKVADQVGKAVSGGIVQQAGNRILNTYATQGNDMGGRAMQALPEGMTDLEKAQVAGIVHRGLNERAETLQQDPANEKKLNWLDDQIASGQVGPQALGLAEALHNQGVLTQQQYRVTRNEILRGMKKGANDTEELAYIDQHMKDGQFLENPQAHERGVGLYFAEATMGVKPGEDRWNQSAVDISHTLGVVPSAVGHYTMAALANGNPQEAAQAARTLNLIQKTTPGAYEAGIDKRTQTLAGMVGQSVDAGMAPEQAVEFARAQLERSDTQRQLIDERWRGQKQRSEGWYGKDSTMLREKLADDEQFTTPGRFFGRNNDVPAIPDAMVSDYQLLTKEFFYNNGGNYDQASDLAIKSLKGTWGVYGQGDQRQMMKWAPTAMFPGLKEEDITHDLTLAGHGAARLVEIPGVTASTGGRVWALGEPDQHGLPNIVRRENGDVWQYHIPNPTRDSFSQNLAAFERDEAARAQRTRDYAQRTREENVEESGGMPAVPRF